MEFEIRREGGGLRAICTVIACVSERWTILGYTNLRNGSTGGDENRQEGFSEIG